MGYKYNVKDITANSIVEGREFDLAYGNYVQTINGDFDRENIRTDAVSANVCADNCFGEIFTLSDQNASETDIGFDGSVVGAVRSTGKSRRHGPGAGRRAAGSIGHWLGAW